ncbi:MAG: glycosyltransferase family 2 protein [Pirellulales bacterium]
MNTPLVSIIVPVYRTPAPRLSRFLESVLAQSITDWELIAVDDASFDSCSAVLDDYASRDVRIQVLHRNINGRAGVCRQQGMDRSKGHYLLFADSDDYLRPDACQVLRGTAEDSGADIVACGWRVTTPNGTISKSIVYRDLRLDLSIQRHRIRAFSRLNFALWNKLFRRSMVSDIGFAQFSVNIGEDALFNVEALCKCATYVTTSYIGYDYMRYPDSVTGRAVKNWSYLDTLAESDAAIRTALMKRYPGNNGEQLADLMSLKAFATGCEWISESDGPERSKSWNRWVSMLDRFVRSTTVRGHIVRASLRLLSRIASPRMTARICRVFLNYSSADAIADKIYRLRALDG